MTDLRMDVEALWLVDALRETVKLSNNFLSESQPPARRGFVVEKIESFNYGGLGTCLCAPDVKVRDPAEQILSILLNGRFRKGNRELVRPYVPLFLDRIAQAVGPNSPIEIVLPTLPFKCQNPLNTGHSPGFTDLGEYLLFAQMRDICLSVEAVYWPGAKITLLCDGLVYADIFSDGRVEEVVRYRENCRDIRDKLGLRGRVKLVDMSTVVEKVESFGAVRSRLRTMLEHLEDKIAEVKLRMASLKRSMLLNIPAPEYSFDEFIKLVKLPDASLPGNLSARAEKAAFDYASFLLTMRYLNIIPRAFPNSIRATVHPKCAPQLPLHLVSPHVTVFPHNGVPVVSVKKFVSSGSIRRATKILRLYQVLTRRNARAVHVGDATEAFYYLVD